jgi:hypothetical protein
MMRAQSLTRPDDVQEYEAVRGVSSEGRASRSKARKGKSEVTDDEEDEEEDTAGADKPKTSVRLWRLGSDIKTTT